MNKTPTRNALNSDTITFTEIKALRAEAEAAGDTDQVRLCDQAMGWIPASGGARKDARQARADAINEASAAG